MWKSDFTPDLEILQRLIEQFAAEIFGFVQVCGVLDAFRAEQISIDVLNEAIRRGDFLELDLEIGLLRERLLIDTLQMAKKSVQGIKDDSEFFSLSQRERAAIYLRHRIGLTLVAISRVLAVPEMEVRTAVGQARGKLLGRPLKRMDWEF